MSDFAIAKDVIDNLAGSTWNFSAGLEAFDRAKELDDYVAYSDRIAGLSGGLAGIGIGLAVAGIFIDQEDPNQQVLDEIEKVKGLLHSLQGTVEEGFRDVITAVAMGAASTNFNVSKVKFDDVLYHKEKYLGHLDSEHRSITLIQEHRDKLLAKSTEDIHGPFNEAIKFAVGGSETNPLGMFRLVYEKTNGDLTALLKLDKQLKKYLVLCPEIHGFLLRLQRSNPKGGGRVHTDSEIKEIVADYYDEGLEYYNTEFSKWRKKCKTEAYANIKKSCHEIIENTIFDGAGWLNSPPEYLGHDANQVKADTLVKMLQEKFFWLDFISVICASAPYGCGSIPAPGKSTPPIVFTKAQWYIEVFYDELLKDEDGNQRPPIFRKKEIYKSYIKNPNYHYFASTGIRRSQRKELQFPAALEVYFYP